MTDFEYDILDELYFVISWPELAQALGRTPADEELRAGVEALVQRGFIRLYFPDPDSEFIYHPMLFADHYPQMLFLASKAGLLAHHGRE